MPRYDYHCPTNGQTVEVSHSLARTLATWGDVCELAGIEAGDTDVGAPVERLMTAPGLFSRGSAADLLDGASSGKSHAHGPGCSCCQPKSLPTRKK